jgi:hypothetical protein
MRAAEKLRVIDGVAGRVRAAVRKPGRMAAHRKLDRRYNDLYAGAHKSEKRL